ncbi:DUF6232 family protein [Streptomyces sp. NPDC049906]|uniref:DUF6232 family protein n=1 Tax=Streptomyces sp. NPDC049906 TaxID=3155656 RepID=UPI0034440284
MQPVEPPAQPPKPPPRPWHVPPAPAAPPPDPTGGTGSLPTGLTGSLDLRVSQRLLWVGGAVYPLHNIARVYTYTLHPRRKEAVVRFVRRVGLTLAVTTVLSLLGMLIEILGREGGGGTFVSLAWAVALGVLVYALVDMIMVLSSPTHFVLGIETSGPSTAVIAGRDHAQLRQLVRDISQAIENPSEEFRVRVETLVISSPSNYYFGDNVNMYGGNGNVGMANS